ncbi:hypothetical protein K438DRAFT_1876719 [Mycena galopus ATCC 62051]|nr:hypothetical protein K438DRAFT_1876719 [Mycena galopus ATCC 62051]
MIFIALRKGVSTETYKSWNTRQDAAETSSDVNADVILSSNDDDEESANESEYNPAKDPDADAMDLEPVQSTPVGRYKTRIDPLPSKRKSEAVEVDSDTEQPPVTKKLKLCKSRHTRINSDSLPVFIPDSDSESSFEQVPQRKIVPLPKRISSHMACLTCCLTRTLTLGYPPPIFILRRTEPSWHMENVSLKSTFSTSYINPWSSAYKPPRR